MTIKKEAKKEEISSVSEEQDTENRQDAGTGRVFGRSPVLEAYRSGKEIERLFVLEGCKDGPVMSILREARKAEKEARKLAAAEEKKAQAEAKEAEADTAQPDEPAEEADIYEPDEIWKIFEHSVEMMVDCGPIEINPTNIISLVGDQVEVIRGELI